jgi:hypothetical protein
LSSNRFFLPNTDGQIEDVTIDTIIFCHRNDWIFGTWLCTCLI